MLFPGDTISVNDAARRLTLQGYETSASQIRKLGNLGLVNIGRGNDKRREITAEALERLEIILDLRLIGLPLNDIKRFILMYNMFERERQAEIEGDEDTLAEFRHQVKDEERRIFSNVLREIEQRLDRHVQMLENRKRLLREKFPFAKEG